MEFTQSLIQGVKDLTGVQLAENDLANVRPELLTVLLIAAHNKNDELTDQETANLFSLFERIRKLQLQASKGDESAKTLIKGIVKLANPPKMIRSKTNKKKPFLPIVKDLVIQYQTSPHLKHAWEVRRIMSQVSEMIEPTSNPSSLTPDEYNPPVRKLIPTSQVKLCNISPRSSSVSLYKEVQAVFEKITKRTSSRLTWEGLAKKIYIERLTAQGLELKIDENSLNRSMRMLKEFEKKFPEEIENSRRLPVRGGDPLYYQKVRF